MLQRWARQKQRAMTGTRKFADGGIHDDGFSSMSASAFGREGGSTGGSSSSTQHYAEVYTGDALLIWRIFATAPRELVEICTAHYLEGGDANRKARNLHISRTQYWTRLECACYYIAGRLDAGTPIEALQAISRRPDAATIRKIPTDA